MVRAQAGLIWISCQSQHPGWQRLGLDTTFMAYSIIHQCEDNQLNKSDVFMCKTEKIRVVMLVTG